MGFSGLLLVCIIICYIKLRSKAALQTMPNELEVLYPYSNFCLEKEDGINNSKVQRPDKDMMPCCSSCSCSPDCGRKRNCCKYEYDLYKLDETICKKLLLYTDVPNEPYYHIIDKCPNISEKCSSQSDTGQHGYSPVYSKDSGMIYYNEICAECNKQLNVVKFSQIFLCGKKSTSYFGSLYSMHGCTLRFRPPKKIDISTEICCQSLHNECSQRTQSAEYRTLCYSFNATFHTKMLEKYSNVFCYICSLRREINPEIFLRTMDYCPVEGQQKDEGDISLSILLDTKTDLSGMNGNVGEMNREFCKIDNGKEVCRPVYCPEGKIYIDGTCQVLGKRWYFNIRINVKLVTPIGHEECSVSYLPEEKFYNQTNFYLKRPGLQDSKITLYYNIDSDNVTVRFFLAMLVFEMKKVEPESFLKTISKSLRTNWTLYMNGRTFVLAPMLGKYTRYEKVGNKTLFVLFPVWMSFPIYFDKEIIKKRSSEIINVIGGNADLDVIDSRGIDVYITKLFFCNLVELYEHEVDDMVIRLTFNNRSTYLEDGEFTLVGTDTGMHKARVCIQDVQSFSGTPRRTHIISFLCFCFIYTYFMTK